VPKPLNFRKTHLSSKKNKNASKIYLKIQNEKDEESSQLLKLRDGLSKDTRMIRHLEKSLISIINKIQKKCNKKKRRKSRSHSLNRSKTENIILNQNRG